MKLKNKLLVAGGISLCIGVGMLVIPKNIVTTHTKEIKSDITLSRDDSEEKVVECIAKDDFADVVYSVEDDTMYKIPDPPEFTKDQIVIIRVDKDNNVIAIGDN